MNKNSQSWAKEKRVSDRALLEGTQYTVKDILKPAKDLSSIGGKQGFSNVFFPEQQMNTVSFVFQKVDGKEDMEPFRE